MNISFQLSKGNNKNEKGSVIALNPFLLHVLLSGAQHAALLNTEPITLY